MPGSCEKRLRDQGTEMSRYFDRKGRSITMAEWAQSRQGDKRRVALDTIKPGESASTVWLGLDHRGYGDEGTPLIFETMIFGGPHDQYLDRYSTEEAALAGHNRIVAALREGRDPKGAT